MKKKLLIAATGSVAVIKLKRIIDSLNDEFDVKLIASDYILKNYPEIHELNPIHEDPSLESFPKHIELSKWADQIIVVPATANTIAKFHACVADNPLLSTIIAARQKVIFVPAMNTYMYKSLVERNIVQILTSMGHMFIGPTTGRLREGESGLGRMVEPDDIVQTIKDYFNPSQKRIVITYGASKVFIDKVRYITNGSTGVMGKLLVNELRLRGFDVVGIDVSDYSNKELLEHIRKISFDIYISAAALADMDFNQINEKIKKNSIENINFKFTKNIDVLDQLKQEFPDKTYVGFKYDDNKENAINKKESLGLDLMIWNKIGAMGNLKEEINGAILSEKETMFNNVSKQELAKMIAEVLNAKEN